MNNKRNGIIIFVITALLAAFVFMDIRLGSVSFSWSDMWRVLFGGANNGSDEMLRAIILRFRIPKALVAVLAGAALSASGLQMQTLFRNPLAGPYVLGVSSGAGLGAALFIMGLPLAGVSVASDFIRNLGVVGAAWIGAAAILLVVMAVSARLKDVMSILILGMMFGSAASAFIEILQYVSPEGAVKSYSVWTMGSLGGVTWGELYVLMPVCAIGLIISVLLIKPLNVLMLGENYARTMGINVRATRGLIFLGTILLAGTVTAFCGPIGFIGIAVPHVARMVFVNADHRVLMPGSMLLGAAIMVLCDILSQLPGSDMVLPVNTVTALLGIPVVVFVIIRNRRMF